jgi:hypothetical protein
MVTRWMIEREMLGQYQRARGLLYPLGPFSPVRVLDHDPTRTGFDYISPKNT